jgi:DNA-binding response OmpR family regulator
MSDSRQSGTTESRVRVIVADDDPAARQMIATALASVRFAVTQAHDGKELYELLTSAQPGYFRLVVADHSMPHLFGVEVLARAGARAPFMIMTGHDTPEVRDAARKYGAAAYVTKPVEISTFLDTVDEIVFGTTSPLRPKFRVNE